MTEGVLGGHLCDNTPGEDGVSLVVPAYNEETRLGKTLDSYLPVLERLGTPFEVLVIMDGVDDTPSIVQSYATRGVIGFQYKKKLGRGGAIFEGFRKARYRLVAYADADGSVPPSDVAALLRIAAAGERAVIASRRLRPSCVVVPEPRFKRLLSYIWHGVVRVSLGVPVMDAQCGLKVFDRDLIQIILKSVTVSNRTFEVGMLYHLFASGVQVREVPVAYVHDMNTRMPIGRAIPVMFLTLMGIFLANRTRFRSLTGSRLSRALNQRFADI